MATKPEIDPTKRRVSFFALGDPTPVSLWVRFVPKQGGADVTLLHDYPDFHPSEGWRIESEGKAYKVRRVDGLALDCVAVESE